MQDTEDTEIVDDFVEEPDPFGPTQPRAMPGQPPFVPNDAQRMLVRFMAANRVPQRIIARNITRYRGDREGICEITLRKVFRQELDEGYERTVASMGLAVIRSGLAGNVMAQKYWLQTHAGDEWKVTDNVRHGFSPDASRAGLAGASIVAPVLVIQPVRAIDVDAETQDNQPTPALRIIEASGDDEG
jgi:hypothetical protein